MKTPTIHKVVMAAGAICFLLVACQKDEVSAPATIPNAGTVEKSHDLRYAQVIGKESFDQNSKITESSAHQIQFADAASGMPFAQVDDRTVPGTARMLDGSTLGLNSATDSRLASVPTPRLSGVWQLRSIYGAPIQVHAVDRPFIKVDGKLNGYGGCNRIFGYVTQENNQIMFTDIGSTRRYCSGTANLEQQFLAALHATDSFYQPNAELYLYDGEIQVAAFDRVRNPDQVVMPADL